MDLHGLQKMTLLDYPGHVACTVFLGGCDFRCPFCHNFELVNGTAKPVLTDTELLSFLKKRVGLLDGVAITGGEPLMRDLAPLLMEIKALGYPVKLDTNGAHPERLRALLDEKLVDYIAMDVKNCPERYAETVGLDSFDLAAVRESIALVMSAAPDYEFRTTAVAEFHNDASFPAIGALIRGARRYYIQAFTDRESVPFAGLHAPAPQDLARWLGLVAPYVERAELRGV